MWNFEGLPRRSKVQLPVKLEGEIAASQSHLAFTLLKHQLSATCLSETEDTEVEMSTPRERFALRRCLYYALLQIKLILILIRIQLHFDIAPDLVSPSA